MGATFVRAGADRAVGLGGKGALGWRGFVGKLWYDIVVA